jgi:O-acetyl-ADP-ribose deacetylase (regulator of RNase III)
MIETKFGDMLSATEGILVHGCNCHGIMGSGIAHLVREKWPDVHQAYRNRHIQSGLQLGDVIFVGSSQAPAVISQKYLHAMTNQLPASLIVANAMTQFTCGSDKNVVYVDYDAVFAAFARINLLARDSGLTVNFPLIGCGLGNGQWKEVASAIEASMAPAVKLVLWKLPA